MPEEMSRIQYIVSNELVIDEYDEKKYAKWTIIPHTQT